MTSTVSRHLRQAAILAVAALALQFAAGRAAQAFTLAPANGAGSDGSANLQDLDKPLAGTTSSDGSVTYRSSGGVSLQFGARSPQSSFEAEYNSGVERLFNPVGRPGGPDGR